LDGYTRTILTPDYVGLKFVSFKGYSLYTSVVDPHHVDADPDADSDSTFHPDADQDADPDSDFLFDVDPRMQIRIHNTALYINKNLLMMYNVGHYTNKYVPKINCSTHQQV
jgi:hypothetical protein